MRLLLCLNRDLMSNIALNLLRPALAGHRFDIVLSRGIGSRTAPKAPQIEAWGRMEHALVEGALFPLLERLGNETAYQTFEQIARAGECGAVREFATLNAGDGLAYLQRFAPDAIVSIRYGRIFKAPAIAVPRLGILNLHSGLLPAYRGVLATFWAMKEGVAEIGCTLHGVTDGTIDTGAIIGTHALPADRTRSLLWNIASLYGGGTAMIAEALQTLAAGRALATTLQDPSKGRYFTYPGAEDVQAFLARGHRLYSADDYAGILEWYGIAGAEAQTLLTTIS